MDKNSLRPALEVAFGDVPYPGDDNVGAPDGRDDGEAVTELYRGQDWRLLEPDEMWGPGLHFMTPEALHYFLPAFLLVSNEVDMVYESLLSVLRPERLRLTSPPDERFLARYGRFTPAQKKVVLAWLDWQLEEIQLNRDKGRGGSDDETYLAKLRNYWQNF